MSVRLCVATLIFLLALSLLLVSAPGAPLTAQTIVATVQLPEPASEVAINPITRLGYLSFINKVGVIDVDTYEMRTPIQVYPSGSYTIAPLAVNSRTNRLYTGAKVINLAPGVITNLPCGGDNIAIDEATNTIYFGDHSTYQNHPDVVCIVDGATNTKLARLELGVSYYFERVFVAVNERTGRAYATYSGDNTLRVISGATHAETDRIAVPNVGRVAVNPATDRVYVVSGNNTLALDGASLVKVGEIKDVYNLQVINPLTGRLYASTIPFKVVDLATNQMVGSVKVSCGMSQFGLDVFGGRVFAPCTFAEYRDRLTVIQDAPAPTTPTPTATPTLTPTPTPTATSVLYPGLWLPLIVR